MFETVSIEMLCIVGHFLINYAENFYSLFLLPFLLNDVLFCLLLSLLFKITFVFFLNIVIVHLPDVLLAPSNKKRIELHKLYLKSFFCVVEKPNE